MVYQFEAARVSGGIAADERYWGSLEEGAFRMCRCAGCGVWMWPAHWRCAKCGSWDQDWVEVEPRGTVYSWTRTWMAFERVKARAAEVPYVVVLAELPHVGGARVMGVLKGDDSGLRIGAAVVGTIDPPRPEALGYAAIRWTIVDDAGAAPVS